MNFSRIKNDQYRIIFLKFEDIFKSIEINILNDLNEYNLIKNNIIDLRNSDTKRLIYHYIIKQTCDKIIYYKSKYSFDVIITYNTIFDDKSEICSYIDCNKLYEQILRLIKKIESNLPIIFYKTPTFDSSYFDNGEGLDTIKILTERLGKNATGKKANFLEISKFAEKNQLNFLKSSYFNKLTANHLMN
jgi:hypothetical protein